MRFKNCPYLIYFHFYNFLTSFVKFAVKSFTDMDKYSGEEIINAFLHSNSKIIQDLYKSLYPMIRKFVLTNSGEESDIHDLVSESVYRFILTIQTNENFKLSCSFNTYIYSISRNIWLSKLKKNKIEVLYDTSTIDANVIDTHDIEEIIKDSKKYSLYLRHFSKISELCQKVIQMFLDKMSLAEIAKITGVTEDSAKQRNYDCKKKLIRSIMEDDEFSEIALNIY